MSATDPGSYTRSGRRYDSQKVTNASPILHDSVINVDNSFTNDHVIMSDKPDESSQTVTEENVLTEENPSPENEENTVVQHLLDASSHKIEQVPSASHQNYHDSLNPDWRTDLEGKFQDCQEAIRTSLSASCTRIT